MATSFAAPRSIHPPVTMKRRNYLDAGTTATPTPNPIGYNGTSNPQAAATNQRAYVTGEGDALQSQYQSQYQNQNGGAPVNTVAGTADYLNSVEDPLAQGQGGYNSTESSQINLTPQQEQNIATNAGVAAGATTEAGVGAANRAAAATGGNPLAEAAYRARAGDTAGVNAGNAVTGGEIAAQQAGSAGAQATGNARLAQQNQGLQYYQGQNSQANQNAEQANQLQETAYGTEAGAGNNATATQVGASQIPTTTDKIIGGVSGAVSNLADGTPPSKADAVVGENGPEWVGKPKYLDDGDMPDSGEAPVTGTLPNLPGSSTTQQGDDSASVPFWQRLANNAKNQQATPAQPKQAWNTTTPYQQGGAALGKLAALAFLSDGDAMPAGGMPDSKMPYLPMPPASSAPPRSMLAQGTVITKPTAIKLDPEDAVVPLSYRATAKIRPSAAMNKPKMASRSYGAAA